MTEPTPEIQFGAKARDAAGTAANEQADTQIGERVRDAAVDPRPEDYVVPTNAGQADPHGPTVRAITVDSPLWEEFVARDRHEHPERYAGIDPNAITND